MAKAGEQGAGSTTEGSDHHVHFDSSSLKDEFKSDGSASYQLTDNGIIVNLGFLKINHRYSIDLKLPNDLFEKFTDTPHLVPSVSNVPNTHCRIADFSGIKCEDNYFDMKIELFAYKEHLLKENLFVVNSKKPEELLKLIIAARVLGKGQGMPMLRNGIHCIGSEKDDESEASDFTGFGNGA